jgi:hypothetical protein
MTKDLIALAAWALFATCSMALAASWQPQTYIVVHAEATPAKAGVVAGRANNAVSRGWN